MLKRLVILRKKLIEDAESDNRREVMMSNLPTPVLMTLFLICLACLVTAQIGLFNIVQPIVTFFITYPESMVDASVVLKNLYMLGLVISITGWSFISIWITKRLFWGMVLRWQTGSRVLKS
jgi:hypothetical protein